MPRSTATAEAAETKDIVKTVMEVFEGDIESIGGVYTDDEGKPLSLWGRMVKIMESLPTVDPEGKNQHFNYKFITNTQINGLLRPRLARQKIMLVPMKVTELDPIEQTTGKGGRSLLTRLHIVFQLVDCIHGETFTGEVIGYGDDSGDKGANKAYTAGLKNFLIKLFLIGGDSDDLEMDEAADRRAKAREAGSERVATVVIGETDVTNVKPGGKSEKATEAQIARVGQYVRDLELTPEGVATFADKVLGDQLELGEKPWDSIKDYLESLTGPDIGKLIARFDEVLNTPKETSHDDADPTNNYG